MPPIKPNKQVKFSNPAPDQYNPIESTIRKSAPQFSLSPKLSYKSNQSELGPGAYDPKIRPSSKMISLSGRHPELTKEDMPGPGQYKPQNGIGESKFNSFTFNSPLHKELKSFGPGPAGYQIPTRPESPQFSIRGKQKSIMNTDSLQKPGPNQYNPKLSSSAKQIAFKSRYDIIKNEQTPGPGHYKLDLNNDRAFTFGERTNVCLKSESPGPIYLPEAKQLTQKISIREKLVQKIISENPSPDRYSPTRPVSSLGTSLKSRVEYHHFEEKPGPDQYSLDKYTKTRPGSPSFSLYSKHFPGQKDQEVPAPNRYENLAKRSSSPVLSMRFRVPLAKDTCAETPGPGEYDVCKKKTDKYACFKQKKK
uniref:H-SHIPPO 1 n=1 Tax=Trepomonas sp. PC1 TaxID=1076344 RepID=A0A146K4R3_9EUKA|eukprot:JAP91900.1 H-SHIPPO 1 [Trepomonas sp. PC1]